MKEYTFLAVFSVFITLILEKATRLRIFRKIEFYIFLVVILFFKILVNGYLTGENIVIYNPEYFLGLRLGTIPIEDFLFGFSMIGMTLIFWEYFKRKDA